MDLVENIDNTIGNCKHSDMSVFSFHKVNLLRWYVITTK